MAIRDFRGAYDDPAMTRPERFIAFGERSVFAFDVDPAILPGLLAPWDGIVLDDGEEPDPPPEPTCAPTEMTWYMAGASTAADFPEITCVTTEGEIGAGDPVVVDVTDDSGDLARIVITVSFASGGSPELVYEGLAPFPVDSFPEYYAAGSSVVVVAGGRRFTLNRASGSPGWPDDFEVKTRAWDALGNYTEHVCAYTVSGPVFDACINPGDPPLVTILYPLPFNDPGFPIARTAHIGARITDPQGRANLRRCVPVLIFPDRPDLGKFMIHDGDNFDGLFAGSSRQETADGWDYDIIWHAGSWPSRPKLLPFAYDLDGNEAP